MNENLGTSSSVLPSPERVNVALALLRVVVGSTFVAHGVQKLFQYGLPGVTEGFAAAGVPMPAVTAPAVALVELLAGAALVVGLLTRLAAAGLAVIMIGAIVFVHLSVGFFLPDGSEFALVLLSTAVMLVLTGPGAFSLDAMLARRGTRGAGRRSFIGHAEGSRT